MPLFAEIMLWVTVALTALSGVIYLWRNRAIYLNDSVNREFEDEECDRNHEPSRQSVNRESYIFNWFSVFGSGSVSPELAG